MTARHLYSVPRRITAPRGRLDVPVALFWGGLFALYAVGGWALAAWWRS